MTYWRHYHNIPSDFYNHVVEYMLMTMRAAMTWCTQLCTPICMLVCTLLCTTAVAQTHSYPSNDYEYSVWRQQLVQDDAAAAGWRFPLDSVSMTLFDYRFILLDWNMTTLLLHNRSLVCECTLVNVSMTIWYLVHGVSIIKLISAKWPSVMRVVHMHTTHCTI